MKNLLKKEFRLCMHPAAWIMLSTCALALVPNYPYAVSFFYMTLGIFFICIGGRENHDAAYTMTLPVSRAAVVKGRVLFVCCLEGLQWLVMAAIVLIKRFIAPGPNAAGMDANIALLGEGLILFGLFNIIFFPAYYRNISKVGVPFVKASIAVFLYVILAVAATYTVPFVRDQLDTPDPDYLTAKLGFLALGLVWFTGLTLLSVRLSVRRFEKLDLQL